MNPTTTPASYNLSSPTTNHVLPPRRPFLHFTTIKLKICNLGSQNADKIAGVNGIEVTVNDMVMFVIEVQV
ncbi:hypothetical protein JHK87_017221 [Glycine soja]|nr:hypothetical protein JHK87_017221 [Glycine soja]